MLENVLAPSVPIELLSISYWKKYKVRFVQGFKSSTWQATSPPNNQYCNKLCRGKITYVNFFEEKPPTLNKIFDAFQIQMIRFLSKSIKYPGLLMR